jgi:hypothetical protein
MREYITNEKGVKLKTLMNINRAYLLRVCPIS